MKHRSKKTNTKPDTHLQAPPTAPYSPNRDHLEKTLTRLLRPEVPPGLGGETGPNFQGDEQRPSPNVTAGLSPAGQEKEERRCPAPTHPPPTHLLTSDPGMLHRHQKTQASKLSRPQRRFIFDTITKADGLKG